MSILDNNPAAPNDSGQGGMGPLKLRGHRRRAHVDLLGLGFSRPGDPRCDGKPASFHPSLFVMVSLFSVDTRRSLRYGEARHSCYASEMMYSTAFVFEACGLA